MAVDYSKSALSKGTPRIVDRVTYKREREQRERDCRRAVKARDKGKCVIPGCKDAGPHKHHIRYRSRGGKWTSSNVCSLCPAHHQMVHLGKIQIDGDADTELFITGNVESLRFKL